jgi:hypothetical protein
MKEMEDHRDDLVAGGLHSSTFRLNVSAFCGIGCVSGFMSGVFRRCWGVMREC